MAAIYIITSTDPAVNGSFSINPNQINGPGESTQTTNLTMFGSGSLRYGQDLNENFLHLLENFASPELTALAGSPPAPVGLGIPDPAFFNASKSLQGQLWFNSSTNTLMMLAGSPATWVAAGGAFISTTSPVNPQVGDLWYDIPNEQLMVYNGTTWESVAGDYLLLDGTSTMLGSLDMGANPILNISMSGSPVYNGEAATVPYVDAHITNFDVHLTSAQNTLLDGLSATLSALDLNALDDFDPIYGDDVGSVQTQLDAKVSVNGDAMTSNADITFSGGGEVLGLPATPSGNTAAASKLYVDNEIDAATSGAATAAGAEYFVKFFNTKTAISPQAGDIYSNGTVFELYTGTIWRQIYPAVYA